MNKSKAMTDPNIKPVSVPKSDGTAGTQQTPSPPQKQQTIHIQRPPPPPPPPQQPMAPPPQAPPPPHPMPVTVYAPPQPQNHNMYNCFVILKITQIVFCVLYILLGVMFILISPNRQRERDGASYFIAGVIIIFVNIFGVAGALCEILCLQITYAIMVTVAFPYCVIPWVIVYALCDGWNTRHITPQQPVVIHH